MKNEENKTTGEIFAPDVKDMIGHTIEELISMAHNADDVHSLIRNGELEALSSSRNEISDLVKSSYRLPKVDSPEKMLVENNRHEDEEAGENEYDPYRMVNLISKSFKLPEFDEDNFLR